MSSDSVLLDGSRDDLPADAPGTDLAPADAATEAAALDLPPAPPAPRLDVLFMVDNTATNLEEQQALAAALPAFVRGLRTPAGGLPDLRVGVISSNMGAGTFAFNSCPPLGDRGRLQVSSRCGLDLQGPRFLAVDGHGRQNFSGQLETVLACQVRLGSQGCTFGHALQSIRYALTPSLAPENAGFVRPDAHLAIVLVADEDDCSADPEATIFQGTSYNLLCAFRGHLCNGAVVPEGPFSAPLASCQPFVRSDDAQGRAERLINVSDFTAFVNGLKPDHPERVLVAALIGWDDRPEAQYRVEPSTDPGSTQLELAPLCASGSRPPKPGIRLKRFADSFGSRGSWSSLCPGDLGPPLEAFAQRIARSLTP